MLAILLFCGWHVCGLGSDSWLCCNGAVKLQLGLVVPLRDTESAEGRARLQLFLVPGLRHAWHWLGMRPVSRKVMASILASGGSVALCPGGVQVLPPPPPPPRRAALARSCDQAPCACFLACRRKWCRDAEPWLSCFRGAAP